MSEKILFVDDEPAVLQGYQRLLHNEFKVTAAVGGAGALIMLQHQGPFAVVVSDMRMPGMDGIAFLLKVKTLAPDAVRIMLTGMSDLQTAIDAVNEGNIFRFLSKPSTREIMVKALKDVLEQHRLVCAERDLLEKTLRGTVYVLTEVLSVVSPAAFSRAMRVRRYVQHVVTCLGLGSPRSSLNSRAFWERDTSPVSWRCRNLPPCHSRRPPKGGERESPAQGTNGISI